MLVLSRKLGEAIVIGGRVLVTVTRVRRNVVSLGITAPPDVCVDRSEIFARKEAEDEQPTSSLAAPELPSADSSEATARVLKRFFGR